MNDFSIQVATANGSGSQSSNTVLLRAIFQMGVPVSGKNLFPSNIAGLPTWYTIRASKDGWIARKKEIDLLVAMNAETAREDVLALRPGAAVVYDAPLGLAALREDLVFYPVPFDARGRADLLRAEAPAAAAEHGLRGRARAPPRPSSSREVEAAIGKVFPGKAKAARPERRRGPGRVRARRRAREAGPVLEVRRMHATQGKILVDGNSAAALGALFAGVTVVTWYPITPSSSLVETLISHLKQYRDRPATGKATYAVVQAEDELAAVGHGARRGVGGRPRDDRRPPGPGISLMSEFVGLGYFAEIPAVIFDVQRVGPSTGLPTRTAQGDVLSTAFLSHGDTQHVLLFPGSVEECFTHGRRGVRPRRAAADAGLRPDRPRPRHERLDVRPVPVSRAAARPREGALAGGPRAAGRVRALRRRGRRRHPLADAPGTDHPKAAYFTRGTGHDETAAYSESPVDVRAEHGAARGGSSRRRAVARARRPSGTAPAARGSGSSPTGPRTRPCVEARAQLLARGGARDRLPPGPRLPVRARGARVRRGARPRLRRGAEPRRPARRAPQARPPARLGAQAAQHRPRARAPARRPHR